MSCSIATRIKLACAAVAALFVAAVALPQCHEPPTPARPHLGPPPAAPSPVPVVAASAAARATAKVTITRPAAVRPHPNTSPAPSAGRPGDVQASSEPDVEVITIDLGADAGAGAAVTPPSAAPSLAPMRGGLGVLVGPFPGLVAVDYRFMATRAGELGPWVPRDLRDVELGLSVEANHKQAGVVGSMSLPRAHPGVYLGAGACLPYDGLLTPLPIVGAGYRF